MTPEAPTRPQRRRPLLALSAGYVRRGADRLPAQGSRHPWVLHQDPVRERLSFALRRRHARAAPGPHAPGRGRHAMRPYVFAGGTAVVTGAASGIGEALAHALADRGSHLVLVDRHAERLDGVAGAVRREHPALAVETVVADLADHDATVALGTRLAAEHPETTLLVNNAGTTVGGELAELSLAEVDRVLEVDLRAVVVADPRAAAGAARPPGQPRRGGVEHLRDLRRARPGPVRHREVRRARVRRGAAPRARRARGRHRRAPGRRSRRGIADDLTVGDRVDAAAFEVTRRRVAQMMRIPPATAAAAILRRRRAPARPRPDRPGDRLDPGPARPRPARVVRPAARGVRGQPPRPAALGRAERG